MFFLLTIPYIYYDRTGLAKDTEELSKNAAQTTLRYPGLHTLVLHLPEEKSDTGGICRVLQGISYAIKFHRDAYSYRHSGYIFG
jgi:hypothetical protein